MNYQLALGLLLLAAALDACQISPAYPPAIAPVTRLYGPVITQHVIKGLDQDDEAVLLLMETTIVRLDLRDGRVSRTPIRVEAGEPCWGLAKLANGSLWTLKGRSTVIGIEPDGAVSRAIALREPHVGLFASGDRLIYQRAGASAPEHALRAGVPASDETTPWSEMRVRSFPGIARVQASALSLVACGRSAIAERPCWFPDEAAVSLIAPDGATRRIPLAGLASVAPEVLLTAENPPRPVRDAYVDGRGRIWVLSSGEAPRDAVDPGGWMMTRYRADGSLDGQVRLAEPVRLVLRVEPARVIVLAGSGHVAEVASW